MLSAMGNKWKVLKYDTCFKFSRDHSVVKKLECRKVRGYIGKTNERRLSRRRKMMLWIWIFAVEMVRGEKIQPIY